VTGRRALPNPVRKPDQTTAAAAARRWRRTIIDSGQGAYYTHRTALPATGARGPKPSLAQMAVRSAEIQESFVRTESENIREPH